MRFATPWFALLLVPLVIVWLRSRSRAVAMGVAVGGGIRPSLRRRFLAVGKCLRPLVLVLVVVALMGPRFGHAMRPEIERGIDVELLLDCSSSMQLRDFGDDLSRLDVVRPVVRKFIETRPLDRIGLMSFALYPRVVSPLTRDHDALLAALDALRPTRPNSEEDSTAIGVALAAAGEKLAASDASSRVIILLTDGEERVNDVTPSAGAEYLAAKGIRLYTIAAGTAGRASNAGSSDLDALAQKTGGKGFVAHDSNTLMHVYRAIDALEKSDAIEQRRVAYSDGQGMFLVAAAMLLIVELLLRGGYLRGAP